MAQRVAFNPTESPVVIDDDGHTIPGLERGEVDTTSDAVKQAVDAGRLVWAETPPSSSEFDLDRSIDSILASVGDDAETAKRALAAENATASPRSTLTAQLQKIIEKGDA